MPPSTAPSRLEEQLAELDNSFELFLDQAKRYPRTLVQEKPTEIAFSATEIVYHMLDVERLWQTRMQGLCNGSMTHFQQLDPDTVAREAQYNVRRYEPGISELQNARRDTYSLVRSMKPEELERTGFHSRYGEMNTFAILAKMAEHDRTHTAQLERTLRQVGN